MSGKWRDFTMPGDMSRRRISFEPGGNLENGKFSVETRTEELSGLYTRNRERYAEEVSRSTSLWDGRNQVKVGEIPLALIEHWKTHEGIDVYSGDPDAQKKITQYLNSNEFEALRTAPGKI